MKRGRTKECSSSFIADTMPAQLSSSSPADKVASIDDLLTEILLWLPVRSLLRFKSVSKHWYFLITSPSFKLLRSRNPDPPSGMFVAIPNNKPYFEFVSFNIENPVKAPFATPYFYAKTDIKDSCNGLILFSRYNLYYMYNPTINQFITLPIVENYGKFSGSGMTIAFDPSKSSDYRIIYGCVTETNYKIEIFSSTTCTWKPSCQIPFDRRVYLTFENGVYWNNAIHWIQFNGYVLYFNLNEETFHEKETPRGRDASDNGIFESQDQLLLVGIEGSSLNTKLIIHELKRDYSAWSVKYHVDLKEVGGPFPESKFRFVVLSIVLGKKEDDSFLVLQINGEALRFNLATNTFHKLHYSYKRVSYGKPVYPFIESLYNF